MLDVKAIVVQHANDISDWHLDRLKAVEELPYRLIQENNRWNYELWHEEDIARIKGADPSKIMAAKQNIDRYNQNRNDSIEKIDEWILNYLVDQKVEMGSKLHSETPGMMMDRLSIMALRKYHMHEESVRQNASEGHRLLCKQKIIILEEQIADLSLCLSEVLIQLERGELKFKVYRQLKMYNDPDLNPQLYSKPEANE